MNARYHASREAFLDTVHRFLMFMIIILGAAAVTELVNAPWLKGAFAASAVVFAAFDLTADLSNRARCHALMKRRYFELLADLIGEKRSPVDVEEHILAPQAVFTPSFQLSFAATLALIAAYQYGLPLRARFNTAFGARVAQWGVHEFAAIAFTSVVAGLATMPYAAYNFDRLAPYGVLANLLAMPVVSVWVMPMGILGVLTLPLGFDAVFWRLMGDGIE